MVYILKIWHYGTCQTILPLERTSRGVLEGRPGNSLKAPPPLRGVPTVCPRPKDRYIEGICFHFALSSHIPRQVGQACSSNLRGEYYTCGRKWFYFYEDTGWSSSPLRSWSKFVVLFIRLDKFLYMLVYIIWTFEENNWVSFLSKLCITCNFEMFSYVLSLS